MQYLVDEFEKSLPPMDHPLRKLGVRLTELLDEDQWAECERLLLEGWEHDAADRATGARWRANSSLDEWFPYTHEELARLRETLQGIVDADWRRREELATPGELVRWAKSRAADALRAALTEAQAGLEFAAARLPAQEGDFVPAHLAALEIVKAALASAAQPTECGNCFEGKSAVHSANKTLASADARAELRRLAQGAAWTGRWYDDGCNTVLCDYGKSDSSEHDEIAHPCPLGISTYLAAVHPAAILTLLDALDAALAGAAQPTPAGYVLPPGEPGEPDERMERAIAMVRSFGVTISEARTALARAGRLAAAQPEAPGRWLVVNVGCIECGVSTALVGRFHSKELAEAVANECSIAHAWREGGQNDFQVFDLEAPCSAEYAEAIARAAKAGGTP